MWRWRLLVLVVLCKHSISQPLSDSSSNERAGLVDFEECCPCFNKDEQRSGLPEPVGAASEGSLARLRNLDECPCTLRDADSQGASSIFFPSAMRAAGTFLRPDEKKKDLKPLFNPEVDLASSVLETLREATDEEYKDALARDAAKSAARVTEDILFGDASPQESANIVTIVVNPKVTDDDDVVPSASHIQRSRCIHPLESTRSNLGKMRTAPKQNMILQKLKSNIRPGLLHRNLHNMDNGFGASNVHESILPIDGGTKDFRARFSPQTISTDLVTTSSNNDLDEDCNLGELPTNSRSNKLKDINLNNSPLLQSLRDKAASSLARIPNLRIGKLLPEKTSNIIDDLSLAPSIINEQAVRRLPYIGTNSILERIKHKSKPLSLTNLLNLRDVELISNENKPKLVLPPISNGNDIHTLISKEVEDTKAKLGTLKLMKPNEFQENIEDPDVSPSLVNIQVSSTDVSNNDDNCENVDSTVEAVDVSVVSTENPETRLDNIIKSSVGDEDTDCLDSNAEDSITDATNHVDGKFEERTRQSSMKSSEVDGETPNESREQDKYLNDDRTFANKSPTQKLLDTVLQDKTLTILKENIAKKLEDLKNIKSSFKNSNPSSRESVSTEIQKNDLSISRNENTDKDCQPDKSEHEFKSVDIDNISEDITTVMPEDSFEDTSTIPRETDNAIGASECSTKDVSLQDLQKLSDSMLHQEKKERESKIIEDRNSNTVNEEVPQDENGRPSRHDLDKSSTEINIPEELESPKNIERNANDDNTCKSALVSSNTNTLMRAQSEPDIEASNIIEKSVDMNNGQVESPLKHVNRITQPSSNINEVLSPLPTIGDIKTKLTSMFDKNERTIGGISATDIKPGADILNPVMESDASTLNFKSRGLPSRFLENVNFDVLDLPHASILKNIPTIDLYPYKTNLPLSKDLNLKSMNLQSLENKHDLLGATFSKEEKNKVLDIRPGLDEIKDRLFDSRLEATDHIHSTLKNTQKVLESKFREAANKHNIDVRPIKTIKRPIKTSSNLLETISRNHEDMNDKLKALHMDFSDRLLTMRNDLIDRSKLLVSEARSKPKLRSSSSKNSKTASSRKDPQKTLSQRKPAQRKPSKITSTSRTIPQTQFKLPASASVPVPRTVQIPELKTKPTKSPPLILQKTPSVSPKWKLGALETENTLSSIGRQVNPLKEKKIKVSFSTTARPATLNQKAKSSLVQMKEKKREPFESRKIYKDHRGSPSELKESIILAPTSGRSSSGNNNGKIRSEPLPQVRESNNNFKEVLKMEENSKKNPLRAWPKASESSFLTKVREALQTRLSKVNYSKKNPKHNIQATSSMQAEERNENKELLKSRADMAHSPSEANEIVDVGSPLKENVSYKCRMMCTKE